jgi:flagellar basal body rod protein FlgG
MIKGLYSAVSAMIMNANRQQVLSHNVSNMEVPGFKQILSTAEDYLQTSVADPMDILEDRDSVREVGMLGLGVKNGQEMIDFSQGGIQITNNIYDLAIQGTGFFHIKTPEGDRYSRDGRFIRDASGILVTTEGYQVLGKNSQTIKIPDGQVEIGSAGEILINGVAASQLDFVEFEKPEEMLEHDQGNLFKANGTPTAAKNSSIIQGALETSNVNSAQVMTQMIEILRAYEAAQQMVQNQDELLGKTISSLGRIG